jgi:hypothetical protein
MFFTLFDTCACYPVDALLECLSCVVRIFARAPVRPRGETKFLESVGDDPGVGAATRDVPRPSHAMIWWR